MGRRGKRFSAPRYLTLTPHGWRFQIRIPFALLRQDSFLACPSPIMIRAQIGWRPKREAERLAMKLAALCQDTFDAGLRAMADAEDQKGEDFVEQLVGTCNSLIDQMLADPSTAAGIARGLQDTLSTLGLVEGQLARGAKGNPAITRNADALIQGALQSFFRFAHDPEPGLHSLAVVDPRWFRPPINGQEAAVASGQDVAAPAPSTMPCFSQVADAYIAMRSDVEGKDHPDIGSLRMRARTFVDIIGDRPVDQYLPSDLQTYVNAMQTWPANATKRAAAEKATTKGILESNRDLSSKPLSRKTLQDGYVANIRTMIRHGMADHGYKDPFVGVPIRWPKTLSGSKAREGITPDVLNRAFQLGVGSGCLDLAILPLLCLLTSRRMGLLLHLRGEDISERSGSITAQSDGITLTKGTWRRVPLKTAHSAGFFVLHSFLTEIGFVDWARKQTGWLFEGAHEHSDPSRYVSQAANRLLRKAGAKGDGVEVLHSLRGDAITAMREHELPERAIRLQAGHELNDVHDRYGFRALSSAECARIATLPLNPAIDWTVFKGLDFDALAKARRSRGRPNGGR